jgi:DNA-binding transcriptional regulator YiaG
LKGQSMPADDLRTARRLLGLSAEGMARYLRLGRAKDGHGQGRQIRRWEAGGEMPGPVMVIVTALLNGKRLPNPE